MPARRMKKVSSALLAALIGAPFLCGGACSPDEAPKSAITKTPLPNATLEIWISDEVERFGVIGTNAPAIRAHFTRYLDKATGTVMPSGITVTRVPNRIPGDQTASNSYQHNFYVESRAGLTSAEVGHHTHSLKNIIDGAKLMAHYGKEDKKTQSAIVQMTGVHEIFHHWQGMGQHEDGRNVMNGNIKNVIKFLRTGAVPDFTKEQVEKIRASIG